MRKIIEPPKPLRFPVLNDEQNFLILGNRKYYSLCIQNEKWGQCFDCDAYNFCSNMETEEQIIRCTPHTRKDKKNVIFHKYRSI